MTHTYPPTDNSIRSNLTYHPRTAELIGYFFAEFALMEFGLHSLFARTLGDSNGGGMTAILGQVQSFKHRFEMIRDHAMCCTPALSEYKLIKDIEPTVNEVISFRNDLAHGIFTTHPTSPTDYPCVLMANSLNKRNLRPTELTEDHMIGKLHQVNSVCRKLSDFIKNPPSQYTDRPGPKADPDRHRN